VQENQAFDFAKAVELRNKLKNGITSIKGALDRCQAMVEECRGWWRGGSEEALIKSFAWRKKEALRDLEKWLGALQRKLKEVEDAKAGQEAALKKALNESPTVSSFNAKRGKPQVDTVIGNAFSSQAQKSDKMATAYERFIAAARNAGIYGHCFSSAFIRRQHIPLGQVTDEALILGNYISNIRSGSVKGYVNGQGNEPYSKFRYGGFPMSENGCGVIAVHNALVALGKEEELRDVALYFDKHGAIFRGALGTNPLEPINFFSLKGCIVTTSLNPSKFDALAASSTVCVMTFWNDKNNLTRGAHTVAITKNPDGSIEVYNYSNENREAKSYPSIEAMIREGNFGPIVLLGVSNL
jgi:hypothetical protein